MRRTTPWRQIGKPRPDKVNREGFPSFSRTPEEDLVNVLMTGTTAPHFYASGVQMAEEMAQVLREFKDVEFQTRATIYARQNGYTRELPVASLVSISSKDVRLFRGAWSRVCLNPKDWQKFIDIARSFQSYLRSDSDVLNGQRSQGRRRSFQSYLRSDSD